MAAKTDYVATLKPLLAILSSEDITDKDVKIKMAVDIIKKILAQAEKE